MERRPGIFERIERALDGDIDCDADTDSASIGKLCRGPAKARQPLAPQRPELLRSARNTGFLWNRRKQP